MGLDTSFYGQIRPVQFDAPDPIGAMGRAMSLGEMGLRTRALKQEAQDQDALRAAIANNTQGGAVNWSGALGELGRTAPTQMLSLSGKIAEMNKAQIEAKNAQMVDHLKRAQIYGNGLQSMAGMTPQQRAAAWPEFRQTMIDQGVMDASKIPEQHDEKSYAAQLGRYHQTKEYLDAELTKASAAEKWAQAGKQKGTGATELRKERSGLATTKATQELSVAYNKLRGAAENKTGASDMSLIFAYMKMLDPGSTVREGEYATAQQATNIPGWIVAKYNRAVDGAFLDPKLRAQFVDEAGKLWKAQKSQQDKVDEGFRRLAKKQGVDPEEVLLNFGADEEEGTLLAGGKKPGGGGLIKDANAAGGQKPDFHSMSTEELKAYVGPGANRRGIPREE